MHNTIVLKPGREKSLHLRHPWIFSGAIASMPNFSKMGETIRVISAKGEFLAWAAISPKSQITARVWSFAEKDVIDADFFKAKLQQAISKRSHLLQHPQAAVRLLHSESDGFPGLVIDKYADVLVLEITAAGAEFWRHTIVKLLQEMYPAHSIYERSDVSVRKKEGLELRTGLLAGSEPPELLEIVENNVKILVDVYNGHKTGFYLDQRENRAVVRQYSPDKDVLNCFAYSGGFGLAAMQSGAKSVTNVDISATAVELIEHNMQLNGFDTSRAHNIKADVFQQLRQYRDEEKQFDVVVLDPPKFADAKAQLPKALRGYKDINWLAFRILKPGGVLLTFSCSGSVDADLFQKVVAGAALDAGRDAQIIRRLTQADDHPVALNFPEGSYLKGLVCRVD